MGWLSGVIFAGIAVSLCVSQSAPADTQNPENLPYCDEIDSHPSQTDSPSSSAPGPIATIPDELENNVPNAQQHAAEVTSILDELANEAIQKDEAAFLDTVTSQITQLGELANAMGSRQAEIDNLFAHVLPGIEDALESRKKRSGVVRTQIKALNAKLRALVDSLDRSSYVQEQQKFLNIIDGLMRIQNAIEMKSLGGSASYSTRPTSDHPAHTNALLTVQQETRKPAPREEEKVLDLLHALDLLELESYTPTLPHNRRVALLAKTIVAILGRLIDMFSDVRLKHKDYAKQSRDLWGQELDILQQQTDESVSSLEAVMDQASYYLSVYEKTKDRLDQLIKEQKTALIEYKAMGERINRVGKDHNELTVLRSGQLKKFQELLHYLTYGDTPYTDSVYDFDCNGVIGGTARVDLCGVCGGQNTTCMDCTGTPNGVSTMDDCGVCGGMGKSCEYFCDGVPDSGLIFDLCGDCGGNSTKCLGCDGLPNSGLVLDKCGICGGDGSSCTAGEAIDQSQVASLNQTMLVAKLELFMPFQPDWTLTYGAGVRAAIATIVNVESSRVQLMSAGGSETVVIDISVVVDPAASTSAMTSLAKSATNDALRLALESHGVKVSRVAILDGPTALASNQQ